MRFDTLPMGATCHQVSFHSDTTVKMAQKTQNVMGGGKGGRGASDQIHQLSQV